MNADAANQSRAATLDDLAALNREIAAFVAGGLPLEEGLRQIARDYGGGVGPLASQLAHETAAGKSLDQAIAAQGDALPPVYRAVVIAGLKSGKLAAALEGFAETASRVATLRRIAGQAAIYPLLVAIVAWVMLLAVICIVMPAYDWLGWSDRFWVSSLRMPTLLAWILAVAVPFILLLTSALWWRQSARWATHGDHNSWLRWIPGIERIMQLSGHANFADLLQLLVSCHVPLSDALPLAANASGASSTLKPAAELADALASGRSLVELRDTVRELPPLVRVALLSSAANNQQRLLSSLRYAAAVYRERATAWVSAFGILAPIATTIGVGVGVVGFYALLIWQPYFVSLDAISQWNWR